MDMQQYHEIRVLRGKLEKVMNQLNILEYTRTQVQIRMTRVAKHRQQSAAYLYEMHLATLGNVRCKVAYAKVSNPQISCATTASVLEYSVCICL